jgi:hypothetical protein
VRDGNEIQLLGPGVAQVPNGPECIDAVRWTLELTDSELATLDALDVTDRADGAREGAWW